MCHGSLVLSWNGEIYNYIELREQLESKGRQFRTASDTEVILQGYQAWGLNELLQRLNGMFAIAIYDGDDQQLVLARDRTGQKPLYYARSANKLLFASEIKALLQSEEVSSDLNLAAVDRYLALRYVPQPETLLKSVNVLPAGHLLRWSTTCIELERYWYPSARPLTNQSWQDQCDEFADRFDTSLSATLRADVPVSAYLSGGVDSGLLVASMARMGHANFSRKTYSIGFDSPVDETEVARQLAQEHELEHTSLTIKPDDLSSLASAIWSLERPIGEPLILAYSHLAQAASQSGKVVVSGEGADELFGGYSFHRVLRWMQRYAQVMPQGIHQRVVVPMLAKAPVDLLNRFFPFPAHLGRSGRATLIRFLAHFYQRPLGNNYVALRTLMSVDERQQLFATDHQQLATDDWIVSTERGDYRALEHLLSLQYHDWLQDFALLRQDKLSMAEGLEVRLPYLDQRLIDFAATLPDRAKIHGRQNKVILRNLAHQRLPKRNAARKKQAFYFPLESFYRSPAFQQLIDRTLNEHQIRRRGIFDVAQINRIREQSAGGEFLVLKQLMALAMLELWMQMFIDQKASL